jgi:hypothetical protein
MAMAKEQANVNNANNETNQKLHLLLDGLIAKHQDNEYVYGRLVNSLENLLPLALQNATEVHKQREIRKTQLNADRDEFTTSFLHKNNYFYSPQTELFLKYDGLHFGLYNEDDIQHQILTTISAEKCLRVWKHKINKNIIKRIKERSPLNAIPESVTIQFVLNALYPTVFASRNQAKYFLTMLGECLAPSTSSSNTGNGTGSNTGTNTGPSPASPPLIYILPPAAKEIIREIGNQCYTYFGLPNIFSQVKFKYYDHTYSDCRLLAFNREQKKLAIPPALAKYMIDFLCVASHYTTRYGTADKFLQQCNEAKLVEHALFLAKNTPESIVNVFLEKSLTLCPSSTIETKNMLFLWKKFLAEREIPSIIFHEAFKTILKEKLKYDDGRDCFVGVTSAQLPLVAQFMRFWGETIVDTDTEEEITEEVAELELDEICQLFRNWGNKNINEIMLLELIRHFYPDTVIEDNKYILHIKSRMWDKYAEVVNAMAAFKSHCASQAELKSSALYDAYAFYCALPNKTKLALNVSKRYFEIIAATLIQAHTDSDGRIMATWWTCPSPI